MLSRTVVSGLVPFFLVIFLLATRISPTAARTLLPLTPPPIAPHAERRGPLPNQPLTPTVTVSSTVSIVVTSAVNLPLALSPAPQLTTDLVTLTVTPTVTLPMATIITATDTTTSHITPATITP